MISKSLYDPYAEDKPACSPALLAFIRRAYPLDFSDDAVTGLGGSYTLNLRLDTDQGRFVARFYQAYVHHGRLADIQAVRTELGRRGLPTGSLSLARCGSPITFFGPHPAEVEAYIEKDRNMSTFADLKQGFHLLGQLHRHMKNIQVSQIGRHPLVANHVEPHLAHAWTCRGTRYVRAHEPTPRETQYCDDMERLAVLIRADCSAGCRQLPRQLVHGDFKDNNVFIRRNTICHICDFDFMGERARIDELALSFWTLVSLMRDRDEAVILEQISELVARYEETAGEPLNRDERLALPLAIIRQNCVFCGILPSIGNRRVVAREIEQRSDMLAWSLGVAENLGHWQEQLAGRKAEQGD